MDIMLHNNFIVREGHQKVSTKRKAFRGWVSLWGSTKNMSYTLNRIRSILISNALNYQWLSQMLTLIARGCIAESIKADGDCRE